MSNTFNIKRFKWLLKKTLLEKPMQMFGFTGLLILLVLILYAVIKSLAGFTAAQNLSFIWGLSGGSFFLASFVFGYFSSNASGSSYLTLPASHFEKWFCGVLITGILYPLIFLISYRVIDGSFVSLYHNSLDPSSPFYKQQYESVFLFNFNGIVAWKVYEMCFFLTGAMLVGSLYFNKVAFIKVAIGICILCIGVFGLNWLMAKMLFGNINDAAPFNHVTIPAGKEEGSIELPSGIVNIFNYSIWYIIPAILWVLSFTRLREKEF
jgi:hypothetical protein